MLADHFTLPFPRLQVRAGVLVVDGYGIALRVLYGKLHIQDGIGPYRRSLALDRVSAKDERLERLVLVGKTGYVTLEALAWLRNVGASLVHLSPDGEILTQTTPWGYRQNPTLRAQALAANTSLALELARWLIARKLEGQRSNLRRLDEDALAALDSWSDALSKANSIEDVRLCEARAAAVYWNAWRSVSVHIRGRDLLRMPSRWSRYDARQSSLTGTPRAATNPVNALLNYVYALVEAEAKIALVACGLDPTLGVLHADDRGRDALALDAMEPIRPHADSFVLDLLSKRIFTSKDFVELSNGVCRLRAPLTHELALSMPRWRVLLEPIADKLAKAFQSPKRLVPRIARTQHTPYMRPYASRLWDIPQPESHARQTHACEICGRPVAKRKRRHCGECLPKARIQRAMRAISHAREALAERRAGGDDPLSAITAREKCREASRLSYQANAEWNRKHPNARNDRKWFLRVVAPKLSAFTLSEISEATGLSRAACSRFRRRVRVPHPRHWASFAELVEGTRGREA